MTEEPGELLRRGSRGAGFRFAVLAGFVVLFGWSSRVLADDLTDCNPRSPADDAIAACSRLIDGGQYARDPANLAKAYEFRGFAFHNKGDTTTALADYDKSIQLFPDASNGAYYRRGFVKETVLHDYRGAISDYDVALRHNPNAIGVLVHHGTASFSVKDYARAIDDYTRIIQVAPDFLPAFAFRGDAFQTMGERQKAIDDFKAALAIPEKSDAKYDINGPQLRMLVRNQLSKLDVQ